MPCPGISCASDNQNVVVENRRFVARQAILDKGRKVFGYELLARTGWDNRFTGDSDAATRQMISDGVLYAFDGLTRGKPAFINCTRESLVEGLVTLLPKQTVLEILETIQPDRAVLDACRTAKGMGYRIALDDFRIVPGMEDLVALADYIKVDFRLSAASERREILAVLRGSRAKLVAEKVETEDEFARAIADGFDLFQGYYFSHPRVFASKRAPSSGTRYMRLLAAMTDEHVNFVRLAAMVKTEVTICYQLLRLVNSAGFGGNRVVDSVQSALMLVGEEKFRKLVLNAITLATCEKHPDDLLLRVLQRGRFLELTSNYIQEDAQEQYLLGLLSLMSELLGVSVEGFLDSLPLRPELKDALHGASNAVRAGLDLLEAYEEGDWSACLAKGRAYQISEHVLAQIYQESAQWAEQAAMAEAASVN
jgi:EAL and modified HD-GYP domain-containing signal transduction protein